MNFEQFLESNVPILDKKIDSVLEDFSRQFGKINPRLKDKFDEFKKATIGGKRIRGALVLLGYQISGGGKTKDVLNCAVAFEIFQTAILAQDDIIDKSLLRRGKPSLYNALGGDHKAVSETICLADLGFFICFKLIAKIEVEFNKKARVSHLFTQALIDTVLGEIMDVDLPGGKFNEKDIINIALLKTARYSFTVPLKIGAILAGAGEESVKKLGVFGDNLGIGFQIQDDILGVFGDAKATGKDADSDIKEGKATLLIDRALEKANRTDLNFLKKIYGNGKLSKTESENVKKIFIKTGALEFAQSQADWYFKKATEPLKDLDARLLYSMVDFLRQREK